MDETLGAVSACLAEVFRGALEARGIPTGDGRLRSSATGDWHQQQQPQPATRTLEVIHMRFHLRAEPRHQATAERVLGFYAAHCPLRRKLAPEARVTSELTFEPLLPASSPELPHAS